MVPHLDRAAENGGCIESVADGHAVDGLAADCEGGSCTLGFAGGVLIVAAVRGVVRVDAFSTGRMRRGLTIFEIYCQLRRRGRWVSGRFGMEGNQ